MYYIVVLQPLATHWFRLVDEFVFSATTLFTDPDIDGMYLSPLPDMNMLMEISLFHIYHGVPINSFIQACEKQKQHETVTFA